MPKKYIVTWLIVNFACSTLIPPAFAAHAVILSDEELDSVYAEGLNFNFGSQFGSLNELVSSHKGGNGGPKLPSANGVKQTNNPAIQFVQIGKPSPPSPSSVNASNNASNVPQNQSGGDGIAPMLTPLNPPAQTNQLSNSAPSAAPLNSSANPGDFDSFNSLIAGSALNEAAGNLLNDTGTLPPMSEAVQSTELAGAVSQFLDPVSSTPPANLEPAPATVEGTPNPEPSIVNTPPEDSGVTTNDGQLASSSQPLISNNPIQLDVVANPGSNGQFDIVLSSPSPTQNLPDSLVPAVPEAPIPDTPQAPETPQIPDIGGLTLTASGNGGSNIVRVEALSQQYLSSLVNVNAAGSVVPVILNITININSTVQSLANTNSITISNFNSFSFQ